MRRVVGFHEGSANHISDDLWQRDCIAFQLDAAHEVVVHDILRILRSHDGKQRQKRNEDDLVHDAHVARR